MSSKFSRLDFLRLSAAGAASTLVFPTVAKEAVAPKKAKKNDVNNLINSAVQEILLDKTETQTALDKVAKDWKSLTD